MWLAVVDIKLEGDKNPNTVVAVYYRPILFGIWDCFSIASGSPVSLRICVVRLTKRNFVKLREHNTGGAVSARSARNCGGCIVIAA